MLTTNRAVKNFAAEFVAFNSGSIALASSAVVCYVVGNSRDASEADVTARLKDEIGDAAELRTAQVYKYIGLARQLAALIVKSHDELRHAILDAKAPANATNLVVDFLDGQDVTSLDALSTFMGGTYKRTPRRAVPGAGRSTTPPTGPKGGSRAPAPLPADTPALASEIVINRDPVETLAAMVALIDDQTKLAAMRGVIDARITALKRRNAGPVQRVRGRRHAEPLAAAH